MLFRSLQPTIFKRAFLCLFILTGEHPLRLGHFLCSSESSSLTLCPQTVQPNHSDALLPEILWATDRKDYTQMGQNVSSYPTQLPCQSPTLPGLGEPTRTHIPPSCPEPWESSGAFWKTKSASWPEITFPASVQVQPGTCHRRPWVPGGEFSLMMQSDLDLLGGWG